jgi:uncharacterized damage-inducible protein DinB
MTTDVDRLTQDARQLSSESFAGIIKAYYPYWDAQYRPYLLAAVDALPASAFDFKPRPEMLTAQQIILHIAETELWWVNHVVGGEPYADWVVRHADPAEGWVNQYDAPDHNALRFGLEEAHRHTQRWFGLPAGELARLIQYRREDGRERQWTLHWILDHVQEHEIHHRAQLNLYLRLLGFEPPSI